MMCRPGGGSAIRTVMAIAERMPDVGRRYYERVLEKTIGRLAAYLEARVAAEELAIDDCQLAASQFMLMCQASLFLPFIFQAAPPPSAERIRASDRKRDADVSGGVSGEGLTVAADSMMVSPREREDPFETTLRASSQ